MANFEIIDPQNKIAFLSFGEYKAPIMEKDRAKGFVKFGKLNDFPNELIRYFNEHPEHNAIVGAKSRYLYGNGLKPTNEALQPAFDLFTNKINRFETFDEFGKKISLDCELFNSFYVQVVTNLQGIPIEYFHLNYANCRLNEDSSILYYCNDFTDRKAEVTEYKRYEVGNEAGTYFLKFEYYQPKYNNKMPYVLPEYKGALKEIKSDIDISTFNSNYVMKGFSGGTLVTFFSGEPTPENKRIIKDKLTTSLTGVENAGEVVINYADKDGQAAQISALNVDDLDKKFEFISKRYQQKIIVGHNITNPELFGIKQEGQLGTRVSLNDSYELFLNTYTKPRQKELSNFIEYLFELKTGQTIDLEFETLKPIGLDLSNDADLTQDERRELKGYSPLTAPKVDTNGQPVQVEASESNDALRGLSASENADLYRIIRDYNKGKLPEALAITRVKAYGISTDAAKEILGIEVEQPQQLSKQYSESEILAKFRELAEDDFECEVLFEEDVHIHDSNDAVRYELKAAKMAFETIITVSDLDSAVLNAIKGNPTLTIENLMKQLNQNYLDIVQSLQRIKTRGLLVETASGYVPNEKALEKETEPVSETEIRTVYKYKLAEGMPTTNAKTGKRIKPREFCADLLEITKTKHYTFEKIDSLNNAFGMNAWSYRGGFYTNGNTGETTPYCRHIWSAKTVKVIKKK